MEEALATNRYCFSNNHSKVWCASAAKGQHSEASRRAVCPWMPCQSLLLCAVFSCKAYSDSLGLLCTSPGRRRDRAVAYARILSCIQLHVYLHQNRCKGRAEEAALSSVLDNIYLCNCFISVSSFLNSYCQVKCKLPSLISSRRAESWDSSCLFSSISIQGKVQLQLFLLVASLPCLLVKAEVPAGSLFHRVAWWMRSCCPSFPISAERNNFR